MDKQDYPVEMNTFSGDEEQLTAQAEARKKTEELLRNAGLAPERFYANLEFVDKVIQVLVRKAGTGFHFLKASFAGNDMMIIIKDEAGETKISNNVSAFATHVAIGMMVREAFGIELRSYFNGGVENPESLTENTPQEIRGWVTRGTSILPLSAQQCIDVHCTDLVTGKFLEPERNLAYRDGWMLIDTGQNDTKASLN